MHGADLKEEDGETDRRDGVSDRPSLCWVLKPGAAAAAIRLENNLAFLHRAAGREALSDCIRIVKNRRRSRLCKHASCLLPLLTNWRWFLQEGNKVGFFFLQVMKSENKLQRNFSSACECLRKRLLSLQAPSDISN